MKVQNMKSTKGNDVPNQFIITDSGTKNFQSYDSVIAQIDSSGNVTLDKETWDYSRTTGKYRNQFLGENKAQTQRKIVDGIYTPDDLNS